VAWNPSLPTASTREILIGTSDGTVFETFIEPSTEFYRNQEKYLRSVFKASDTAIVGLWVDIFEGRPDVRRVLVASSDRLYHFIGRVGRQGSEGSGTLFAKFFENERPNILPGPEGAKNLPSALAFSPDPSSTTSSEDSEERGYGWLSGSTIQYGSLTTSNDISSLGQRLFNGTKLLERSKIPPSESASGRRRPTRDPITALSLTQWHLLCFVDGRIVAINRLNDEIVYDQAILESGEKILCLTSDQKKGTYWLFTAHEIFEIAVGDEDRDIWKIMLKEQRFDAALHYAKGNVQKDAVATASGDYLVKKGQYMEAAGVYGKSSKAFEEVALVFIDNGEQDALRKYLLAKISTYKKASIMQRTMIASWLVEIYMAKLNTLDDTITTKAELVENANASQIQDQLNKIRAEFRDFIHKYKSDLDKKTTYEIISSHGREEELLLYATAINDYNYVLSYWIQREKWPEALNVLKKQTEPSTFYKYSSVLMTHEPTDLVEILMRHTDLNPRNLIPALLNYTKETKVPLSQNQAVRYLLFCINQLGSTDTAVHNTLISIYASDPSPSEAALSSYLSSQSSHPSYDADFALRLCIQHDRVESCVHIYSLMNQYPAAVELALKHDNVKLASIIADRPAESNPALRKKLWLAVAKKVIGSQGTGSIKSAIEFLKRCELLRIEDLIPFFPDFVVIDDFKDEICQALESYSRDIDRLKAEMDDSAATANSIKQDIQRLDSRYAIVMPGERCRVCNLPLLSRQFFVFPSCQHGFHSDCLGRKVVEGSGLTVRNRIKELQASIGRGASGPKREREVKELDGLVGKEW
jgi:vacuolar protein sorting-associated protein 18